MLSSPAERTDRLFWEAHGVARVSVRDKAEGNEEGREGDELRSGNK